MFKVFTFLRVEADSNLSAKYCAGAENGAKHSTVKFCPGFARNKITVDVGCVHMLIYNARV